VLYAAPYHSFSSSLLLSLSLTLLPFFFPSFLSIYLFLSGIQNDFSFYKRSVAKYRTFALSDDDSEEGSSSSSNGPPLNEAVAGSVSMWIAEAMPMTATLTDIMKAHTTSKETRCDFNTVLAKVANTCAYIVNNRKNGWKTNEEAEICLSAMVYSIVLFDRLTYCGVFNTKNIAIRKCVEALVGWDDSEGGTGRGTGGAFGATDGEGNPTRKSVMMNCIKYSTVTYNEHASDAIMAMLS
jgi:hypothetical protein